MSRQALDLKRSAQIVRRHKILVGAVAALGLLAGIAYTVLNPAAYTSSVLLVVPPSVSISTQAVVVTSDPVLVPVHRSAVPGVPLDTLRGRIQVSRLTSQLMSISARGDTPAQAQQTASAVTRSYAAYVGAANSPVGQVPTRILEGATTATGTSLPIRLAEAAVPGVLFGALIGAVIAVVIGRKDRRLRERDEMADSIGVPVLASIGVRHPSDAAGWLKLLEGYEPGAVDAWRLRKALHQLGIAGVATDVRAGSPSSLAVLSLSADRTALALGPQLAVYAASLGIPTALVVGPQQDANTTATLRAACTSAPGASGRSRNLHVTVSDQEDAEQLPGIALTVVVAVVDGQDPGVAGTMRAALTVLGVTPGAVSAEQLARVAANAAGNGRDITGILVADPDPADRTTGRLPQLARSGQHEVPTRMTGAVTETRQ